MEVALQGKGLYFLLLIAGSNSSPHDRLVLLVRDAEHLVDVEQIILAIFAIFNLLCSLFANWSTLSNLLVRRVIFSFSLAAMTMTTLMSPQVS